jgi:hypothetical protein
LSHKPVRLSWQHIWTRWHRFQKGLPAEGIMNKITIYGWPSIISE